MADASILPRVTTGNAMTPCVVFGERAAEFSERDHSWKLRWRMSRSDRRKKRT